MSLKFSEFDRSAMSRALELAARGLETTRPNPRVGCVIARRERIVGEGWHVRAGEAHAELNALRAAGKSANGATAYITLEPCSHHGRTPPCVDALIEARIARVVFAMADPNPRVNGQGADALFRAGIKVESGLMAAEAAELNVGFIQRMQHGRPWVRIKSAMSLDGRTALASGASQWITAEAAREDVQRWRARSCAILTGIGTVLADNPRLTVRHPRESGGPVKETFQELDPRFRGGDEGIRRGDVAVRGGDEGVVGGGDRGSIQPLRVVMDSLLRTPPNARLFDVPGEVLISTTADFASPQTAVRAAALEQRGARVECMSRTPRTDLNLMLARLAELEVNELLVEAGPTLSGEFIRQGLADELLIYIAPKLLGPQARPLFDLPELEALSGARTFSVFEARQVGDDLRVRLRAPVRI